jgi:hypothetical protein
VLKKPRPDPRSSFAACLASDTKFYLFGGSGDNNVKYNDLWEFDGANWNLLNSGSLTEHIDDHKKGVELPLQKSGH